MRYTFNIYPETITKIRDSGLEDRVQKLKKSEEGLGYIGGFISSQDIIRCVKWLGENGYYRNIPEGFKKQYKETMNAILNDPENFSWTIERPNGIEKEKCEISDLNLFTGNLAAYILKPNELWDYKKFGFSSPTAFIGAVSAYIIMQSKTESINGYIWTSKKEDGSEIINEITGDSNSDLRVQQNNFTPYKTIDPFGSEVEFRPETSQDVAYMSPYHSTEPSFLVAALKYIEQIDIKAEFLSDRAEGLINWGLSLEHGIKICSEHISPNMGSPRISFINYYFPIPKLDNNFCATEHSFHNVHCQFDGWYSAFIAPDGNLIFAYENKGNMNDPQKTPIISYLPGDAEEIVKGLIYQSAKHLGRTSIYEIIGMLQYRFSEQFEIDGQKMRGLLESNNKK